MAKKDDLARIATRLRIHCLRMTTAAGSGHPTTCLSAADIGACLFFSEMHFNPKDPHDPALQLLILPAQALRGLLFGLILLPFLARLMELGTWRGGLLVGGIIFVAGFVAASGGMIEHFVYFKPEDYPATFAAITFVEILIQTALMGPMIVGLSGRFWVRE